MSIAMIFPIAVASTNFHATAFQDVGKFGMYYPLGLLFLNVIIQISSYIGVIFPFPAVAKLTSSQSLMNFILIKGSMDSLV